MQRSHAQSRLRCSGRWINSLRTAIRRGADCRSYCHCEDTSACPEGETQMDIMADKQNAWQLSGLHGRFPHGGVARKRRRAEFIGQISVAVMLNVCGCASDGTRASSGLPSVEEGGLPPVDGGVATTGRLADAARRELVGKGLAQYFGKAKPLKIADANGQAVFEFDK